MPPSAETLTAAFSARWPDLAQSYAYVEGDLARVEPDEGTLVTALHACGPLTDSCLAIAIRAKCAAVVMPCCHSLRKFDPPAGLAVTAESLKAAAAEVGPVAAIDGCRVDLLRAHGYDVATAFVDPEITPYNKLLLASPLEEAASSPVAPSSPSAKDSASADLEEVPLPASPTPAAHWWHERNGMTPPPPIRVYNATAIDAIKGRQLIESRRSIEVSCWVVDDDELRADVLTRLARRACAEPSGAVWSAEAEANAAFDGCAPAADDVALPTIVTELCDEYTEPSTGRKAQSYRILFSSSDEWRQQISRKETAIWQRRIRKALEARAGGNQRFELR